MPRDLERILDEYRAAADRLRLLSRDSLAYRTASDRLRALEGEIFASVEGPEPDPPRISR